MLLQKLKQSSLSPGAVLEIYNWVAVMEEGKETPNEGRIGLNLLKDRMQLLL